MFDVKCHAALGVIGALLLGAIGTSPWQNVTVARGQQLDAALAGQHEGDQEIQQLLGQVAGRRHRYEGTGGCLRCHDAPTQFDVEQGVTKFVLLTEAHIWQHKDKHSQAYALVDPTRQANQLSRRICQRLGIDIQRFDEARQCLSCHAGWLKDQPRPEFHKTGVGCEACHGPSSNWQVPHNRPIWRKLSPREKAQFGMIDTRDPVSRARQCFSCHIGNHAEGKVVTHEMYAAGHPALLNVEIETFLESMPPHWRRLDEKQDFQYRDAFVEANYGKMTTSQMRTRALVVSGAVAWLQSMQLVADQTAPDANDWPELASFDCYACHHDLKSPSWRQRRGYAGKPGRPPLRQWPTALIRLGLAQCADDAQLRATSQQLQEKLAAVQDVLDRQPFGDPVRLHQASEQLTSWLRQWTDQLAAAPYGPDSTRHTLLHLSCLAESEFPDYESARQISWALRILYQELDPQPATHSQIQALLDSLSENLHLELAEGQKPILEALPATLEAAARYDPHAFRRQLQRLCTLLRETGKGSGHTAVPP